MTHVAGQEPGGIGTACQDGDTTSVVRHRGTTSRRRRAQDGSRAAPGGTPSRSAGHPGSSRYRPVVIPVDETLPAQRVEARRLVRWLVIGFLALITICTLASYVLRPDAATVLAVQRIQEGEGSLILVRNALAMHRIEEARQELSATRRKLGDLSITDGLLQVRRQMLLNGCDRLESESARADIDRQVIARHRDLADRLDRFAAADQPRLDDLTRQAEAFMKEPVPPGLDPAGDRIQAGAYAALVADIRSRQAEVIQHRQRLLVAERNVPVLQAQGSIVQLVQGERFQEAIDLIVGIRAAHPKAAVDAQERYVQDAATHAWEAVERYVDNRLQDAAAPGAPALQRSQALVDARRRLDEVVTRFGMPTYVQQARDRLGRLPR